MPLTYWVFYFQRLTFSNLVAEVNFQTCDRKDKKVGTRTLLQLFVLLATMRKRRCSLGRFNKSTIERHQKNVHQYGEKIDVISSEDPRAISILKELKSRKYVLKNCYLFYLR